ncbi:MAG: hypothetical protein NW215_10620 [Hyphomicrobiales bacterium]|nr:hypothetical protein [Hyphomicrobiales bacterium]
MRTRPETLALDDRIIAASRAAPRSPERREGRMRRPGEFCFVGWRDSDVTKLLNERLRESERLRARDVVIEAGLWPMKKLVDEAMTIIAKGAKRDAAVAEMRRRFKREAA